MVAADDIGCAAQSHAPMPCPYKPIARVRYTGRPYDHTRTPLTRPLLVYTESALKNRIPASCPHRTLGTGGHDLDHGARLNQLV
jgi:hypothetical protein